MSNVSNQEKGTENNSKAAFGLIDENEIIKAQIKKGFMNSAIHNEGLSSEFGVVTDRRFYFKGLSYDISSKKLSKMSEEFSVDVKDITSSGIVAVQNISYIIFGFLFLIMAFLQIAMAAATVSGSNRDYGSESAFLGMFMITFFAAAIVSFIMYFVTKHTIYTVIFAGGSIGINLADYKLKDIRYFDRALRMEKDRYYATLGIR